MPRLGLARNLLDRHLENVGIGDALRDHLFGLIERTGRHETIDKRLEDALLFRRVRYDASMACHNGGDVLYRVLVFLDGRRSDPGERHMGILLNIDALAAQLVLRSVEIDPASEQERRHRDGVRRAGGIGSAENGMVGVFDDVAGFCFGKLIILAPQRTFGRLSGSGGSGGGYGNGGNETGSEKRTAGNIGHLLSPWKSLRPAAFKAISPGRGGEAR